MKALREFGLEYGIKNDGPDDDDDDDEADSLQMSSVYDLLDADSHDGSLIYLPPHGGGVVSRCGKYHIH